jgi:hypothetical protein
MERLITCVTASKSSSKRQILLRRSRISSFPISICLAKVSDDKSADRLRLPRSKLDSKFELPDCECSSSSIEPNSVDFEPFWVSIKNKLAFLNHTAKQKQASYLSSCFSFGFDRCPIRTICFASSFSVRASADRFLCPFGLAGFSVYLFLS